MDEESQTLMKATPISTEPNSSSSSSKLELSVDEVIENYVGHFGLSQILHVILVSLAWIFDSQNTLITIFTDAQPSSWKCKNLEANCGNSKSDSSVCGLIEGSWEWIGGNKSSTIAEWSLICDRKFLAAIPASLFFLGSLFGSAVFGRLADAWLGRKKTVLISCILTSTTSYLTSLSPNIWIYSLLRCANGFARSGIGICCLVLSTESVGRKYRGQVGQYGFFFFTFGFLSLPLIAYPSRTNWRNIYKIMSIFPMFYSMVFLPFVSESPRWLHVMGRNKEAMEILKKFARINGKKLPNEISLKSPSNPTLENGEMLRNGSLWSTNWAVKRIVTVMIAGFGIGFVYYGIQLNVENLSFNLYFTVAVNAMMEIPAVLIGTILLGFAKRRSIFSISAYVAGCSCLLCIAFSNGGNGSWIQLGIEGIGFMAASTAFDVLYVYCVELFPTNVRNFAVSMLRQALMLGASIAPLLVVLGRMSPSISFFVFGILSIFSGVLSLWLPETRNAPLYETLRQQEEEEKLNCVGANSGLELG